MRTAAGLKGVEAVIDKDRVSALLASRLGVDRFIISTDADRVYLDYRKPTQRALDRVTADEMEAYQRAGQFPPGNMGPKIESALRFLRAGGKEVVITSYERIAAALRGRGRDEDHGVRRHRTVVEFIPFTQVAATSCGRRPRAFGTEPGRRPRLAERGDRRASRDGATSDG